MKCPNNGVSTVCKQYAKGRLQAIRSGHLAALVVQTVNRLASMVCKQQVYFRPSTVTESRSIVSKYITHLKFNVFSPEREFSPAPIPTPVWSRTNKGVVMGVAEYFNIIEEAVKIGGT